MQVLLVLERDIMVEKIGTEILIPFAFIGAAGIGIGLLITALNLIYIIREKVNLIIKKYKDRHKFEKPPIAKCYCISCELWLADDKDRTSGRCEAWMDYHTSADEFCARGFVRDDDGYKNEEWRLEDK